MSTNATAESATHDARAFLGQLQSIVDGGDAQCALMLCETRLATSPNDADAHRHLAQIHAACSNDLLAMRHAKRACELMPDDARAWSDLGRVCAQQRQLQDAVRCFHESIRIDPRHADGWHNLGAALHRLGDEQRAFDAFKRALLLQPERAETYLSLGNLLVAAGQFDDAIECFARAVRHDPRLVAARSSLAEQWVARGRVKNAELLFRQALSLNPGHVRGWFGLGRVLEDLGQAESALSCYRQVLAREPGHAQALGHYLALAPATVEPSLLQLATSRLAGTSTADEDKALIGYGLAKYHDRRGNYAEAAHAARTANSARRRRAGPLDRTALRARVDGLIATYNREFFRAHRRYGLGTDQPVFIVGLPRSGTTLTEQILAAHPLLHGAGELPDLTWMMARCSVDDAPWRPASDFDAMRSRVCAAEYLRALRDSAPQGRLRISDKAPLNFFNLGFAYLLFPNARVVHCRRRIEDNALSIWMENFKASQHYATDFADLAFFAAEYQRLMAHWRGHLPLQMLEVDYEDTVSDVESQARRLIDFLGVPWDARCLNFHEHTRAVQTPSRWQVRQPIYTRSVGRWHTYAAHLPELTRAFRAFLA